MGRDHEQRIVSDWLQPANRSPNLRRFGVLNAISVNAQDGVEAQLQRRVSAPASCLAPSRRKVT